MTSSVTRFMTRFFTRDNFLLKISLVNYGKQKAENPLKSRVFGSFLCVLQLSFLVRITGLEPTQKMLINAINTALLQSYDKIHDKIT